jgi:DNA ligase-1
MAATAFLREVTVQDIRSWFRGSASLGVFTRSLGEKQVEPDYLENTVGLPFHLRFVIQGLAAERGGELPASALDSIPFYSLCRGLFLPLASMQPEKVAQIFGFLAEPPPDSGEREELLKRLLGKEIGLTLEQKLACILGDPFLGNPSTFKRDSLVTLLLSMQLTSRRTLVDRLTVVGEVATLFAESRPELRAEPPLTALEVLETLRLFPPQRRAIKFALLRSLLNRMGKLEAFFLARLLLRKAGFGFDYQGELIARIVAEHYGAPVEQVSHAMALTDTFKVAQILRTEGVEGLRKIQIQPLVPVRPALAGGTVDELKQLPVWVERKYDGIRLMLHKSSDERGAVLCGAYTRNRRDWLELVPGLDASIRMLPARNCILDGELHGTVVDLDGARPASVYEVYAVLQGEKGAAVNMKFTAFDIVYLNGSDLTRLPLSERRKHLTTLLAPIAAMPTPVPLGLVEGQTAQTKEDVNRLFHHFRSQGYEGVITKDLDGPYLLAARDPSWRKRKPEVTLDLVLLGAVLAVTTKERAGMFGSYVIGARRPDGSFEDVGDVAGIDRVRDGELQQEIMREGLITGRRIERQSSSGVRPGLELLPHIVVTVRFEGIARDLSTGELSLRDPKLVTIRTDKSAGEADSVNAIQELYLRQRVG